MLRGRLWHLVIWWLNIRDRDDYLAHLKPLGIVHRSFFGAYYPAMALLEISGFFQNETLVEIEGFAVIDTIM